MVNKYTGPKVDVKWAKKQKGILLYVPGSYWPKHDLDTEYYKGIVLAYDGLRAGGGPFFTVKLVDEDKDNNIDYLLPWGKICEFADKAKPINKKYDFSTDMVAASGRGKCEVGGTHVRMGSDRSEDFVHRRVAAAVGRGKSEGGVPLVRRGLDRSEEFADRRAAVAAQDFASQSSETDDSGVSRPKLSKMILPATPDATSTATFGRGGRTKETAPQVGVALSAVTGAAKATASSHSPTPIAAAAAAASSAKVPASARGLTATCLGTDAVCNWRFSLVGCKICYSAPKDKCTVKNCENVFHHACCVEAETALFKLDFPERSVFHDNPYEGPMKMLCIKHHPQ